MVSKILGGGSSGGGGGGTTTTTNEPPAYLVPYLQDLASKSQNAFNIFQGSGFNQPFAGDRTANKNPYDTLGQQMALSAADRAQGTGQMSYDLASGLNNKVNTGGYAAPGNMAYDVKDNNYVQDQIMTQVNPILRNFQESLLPQLKDSAIDKGAYGGTKSSTRTSQLARDTQQQVADLAAQISYQNFNDSRNLEQNDLNQRRALLSTGNNQELAAAGLIPTLNANATQQDLAAANVYSQAGAFDRGFTQADIDAAMQYYAEQQGSPFAGLDQYANLLFGNAGVSGGTTSSNQGGGSSGSSKGQDLLQTAGLLYSVFSDIRTKTDIKKVGEKNGFNLYSFKYLWDATRTRIGVLAQEVEKIMPDAVSDILGVKMVDYNKLGIKEEIA